jgi:hypothetical protein
MGAPVAKAHPAELVLAVEALHVVAAPVLLDADVAFRAVLSQHRASKDNEVNRKRIIPNAHNKLRWNYIR